MNPNPFRLPFGPRTDTVLTARPVISDATGVTFAYVWSVNGAVRPGETEQTIDLGKPGNGDRGDTISVVVTATRGIDSGTATNSALIVGAAPVANDASASGNAGEQIIVPISGSDADGDAFTFKRVGGPTNGVGEFVTAADGSVTFVYRSRARFNGTETIRFVAIQSDGRTSVPATITIAVTSDEPSIGFGVTLTPFGPKTNDTLTASLVIGSTANMTFSYAWSVNGALRPGETSNTLDLSKPGNGDRGDTVTAIVTARRGDSVSTSRNSATVKNSAPTTGNASASGISGSEIVVPIVGADIDGDVLTFKRVGGPRDGTGSFVTDAGGNTTFVYRSRAGFVGTEEVRFVAVDPLNRTSTPATISINVVASSAASAIKVTPAAPPAPPNRAPFANNVTAATQPGVEVAIPLSGSDPDGDPLTFKRVGGPRNGTGEIRRDSDGIFKMFYTPRAGFVGTEEIRFVALDTIGKPSPVATMTINVSSAPSALRSGADAPSGGSS